MPDIFGFKKNYGIRSLLDIIYPVGSLYMSVNSQNPSVLFGGEWERIQGKYIATSSLSRPAGTTYGDNTIQPQPSGSIGNTSLNASQLPAHSHTYMGPQSTTEGREPRHGWRHTHSIRVLHEGQASGTVWKYGLSNNFETGKNWKVVTDRTVLHGLVGYAGGGQPHSHTISLTVANSGSTGSGNGHSHTFTGVQSTIAIQPKYVSVNVWKRTA